MSSARSRQWVLRRRPQGRLRGDDVELVDGGQDLRPLREGEIRIRNLLFLYAPTMRNWMQAPGNSLYRSIPLDTPVRALAGSSSPGMRAIRSGHAWFRPAAGANTTSSMPRTRRHNRSPMALPRSRRWGFSAATR